MWMPSYNYTNYAWCNAFCFRWIMICVVNSHSALLHSPCLYSFFHVRSVEIWVPSRKQMEAEEVTRCNAKCAEREGGDNIWTQNSKNKNTLCIYSDYVLRLIICLSFFFFPDTSQLQSYSDLGVTYFRRIAWLTETFAMKLQLISLISI